MHKIREVQIQLDKPRKKSNFKSSLVVLFLFAFVVASVFFFLGGRIATNSTAAIVNSLSNLARQDAGIKINDPDMPIKAVPTVKPTKNPALLEAEIRTILGTEIAKYGIYIKNLETGTVLGIHEKEILPPASVYKVPLAMLVLKDVDKGKLSLDGEVALKQKNKAYTTDALYSQPTGKKFTIQQYLDYLIKQSDNTAMLTLEELIGTPAEINQRIVTDLNITTFFRDPHICTTEDIGTVFEEIYTQSYLSKETNDLLLDLLTHTASWLQDRIPAGVPSGTTVAHKIGYIDTDNGAAFNDAGIVFSPAGDYVIIMVNQDVKVESAKILMPKISKAVYSWVNS